MMSKPFAQFNHCYSDRLVLYVGYIVKGQIWIYRVKHTEEPWLALFTLLLTWLKTLCLWNQSVVFFFSSFLNMSQIQHIFHWALMRILSLEFNKNLKVKTHILPHFKDGLHEYFYFIPQYPPVFFPLCSIISTSTRIHEQFRKIWSQKWL